MMILLITNRDNEPRPPSLAVLTYYAGAQNQNGEYYTAKKNNAGFVIVSL